MPRTGLDFSDDLGIDAGRLDVDTSGASPADAVNVPGGGSSLVDPVDIEIYFKDGWTPEQQAEAIRKCEYLTQADMITDR